VQTAGAQSRPPAARGPADKRRILSPEEVNQLINRGEASFAEGDVAAARLILERVAEAGDARAALKLGATYDPIVLRGMNVVGIRPDPEQARLWYERAVEFGSREASQRLIALAQRGR
jgi:TPR repeat protein